MRAQTLRESLLTELFGDVDRLLERLEAAEVGLRDQVAGVDHAVAQASIAATARFQYAVAAEREAWAKAAQAMTKDVWVFGRVLAASGQRALYIAVLAGSLSGMVGGLVVALMMNL